MSNGTVIVEIMGKDYQVACPAGQEDALRQSAAYLSKQMNSIRLSGKVQGSERIAVMAALNLSNELLQSRSPEENKNAEKINRLNKKLDEALHRFRQLELP